MADLLEQGSAWLEEQRHRHLTRTVTYWRGTEYVELKTTVGRTEFEQQGDDGGITKFESRDYLLRAADLVLAGAVTLPEAGDRIREVVAGTTYVYEVMAPGSEPPYRFSDPYRRTLRVHTKHVATE